MTPVWQARTGSALESEFAAFSESIADDLPFLDHDVMGSIAHVAGLHKAKLLSKDEATQLIAALQDVPTAFAKGTFVPDQDLEDLHMNIESRLTEALADVGRKVHTGRSRNDQVATCIVLAAREGLVDLASNLAVLAQSLFVQAKAHATTPWTSKTHGQPAQPATLGFLLAAHGLRIQDAAHAVLGAADKLAESPLGSGAVAGSTLPLQPAHTAQLLGLRPPRNALLATGTRDAIVVATGACADAGRIMASLAEDLASLFASKGITVASGYTSGSSLMPQKRNPDALEMARGKGRELAGRHAAVTGITAGLGLGYHRDFQLTKPHLTAAIGDANAIARILDGIVSSVKANPKALADTNPGAVATDLAEALVGTGVPFRTAYGQIAKAYAKVEAGLTLEKALDAVITDKAQRAAAAKATKPDASRRATLGGPAPKAVLASLEDAAKVQVHLAAAIADQELEAAMARALLSLSPAKVLDVQA